MLAALVKALPLERQPKSVRAMTAAAVGKALAQDNLASVSYCNPGRSMTGASSSVRADGVSGPSLLDEDVINLAGTSAQYFSKVLSSHELDVAPKYAAGLANYVAVESSTHPGWKQSIVRGVCWTVERGLWREAPFVPLEVKAAVRLDRDPDQWGFYEAVRKQLGDGLLPDALVSERIEAEGKCAIARSRQQYPIYGYCIVDRDGSRGPLGVVMDPKHCAQVAVRTNDARDPAVNGPYRMVEMRAVPAHDHPPFGRDEHTLGYGIVSAECPLVQAGDGRTTGELIYDGLAGVLEEVRLRNVDATGDLTGTNGPWSAVELRAVPVGARRVREFAQPEVADLDIVGSRGKVLGLRGCETPRIAGTLVGVAQKVRALAIREDDGLVTTLVAPDGNSLANFKGLFGKASRDGRSPVQGASTEGLESITASVRERIGERIDLQVMSPTIVLATLGDSNCEGRAPSPPIPWESLPTLRFGAGDRLMGEVLGVHHFPETNAAGKPYTAAVEMHLGHPLVRKDPDTALGAMINAQPVLVVADTRAARWRRPDGDLAELGEAKPGDVIDVRMDGDGKTIEVRTVARELGADGAIRVAGQDAAREESVTDLEQDAARDGEDEELGR
ncbi:MAG: hypothetical protein ACYCT1_13490 [Steroidobacteraceae bacterium]